MSGTVNAAVADPLTTAYVPRSVTLSPSTALDWTTVFIGAPSEVRFSLVRLSAISSPGSTPPAGMPVAKTCRRAKLGDFTFPSPK